MKRGVVLVLLLCLVIVFVIPSALAGRAIDCDIENCSNLVSHWTLDEPSGKTNDSQGLNNGTVTGATYNVAGKVGNALSFDGNDAMDVEDPSTLDISPNLTLSAWFNTSSSASSMTLMNKYKNFNPDNGYYLRIHGGN